MINYRHHDRLVEIANQDNIIGQCSACERELFAIA